MGFADAIRRWRDLGPQSSAAWCALDWLPLLGVSEPAARAAADDARAAFERVRSPALLKLLDAAVASGGVADAAASPGARSARPDGVEVPAGRDD